MAKAKQDKDGKEKIFRNIFLSAIGLTIVFFMVASYSGLQIANHELCNVVTYTDYGNRQITDSDYTLANTEDYVLQEFVMRETNAEIFEFCYSANVSADSGVRVVIIDKWGVELGVDYLDNSSRFYCTELDADLVTNQNFIGVRCDSCDGSNNVTLKKEIFGDEVFQEYSQSSTLSVLRDNTLDYRLKAWTSCTKNLKFYAGVYFFGLCLLGLMLLVMMGYNKFTDIIFKDW